jgi:UDP-N-acetylmuramoyl-tripeptide--D-alanyl-D-alanine ligase
VKPILLKDVVEAVSGKLLNDSGIENNYVLDISTDSRKIQKGTLFVPIAGEKFDGHNFIEAALAQGAVCALTEKYDEAIMKKKVVIYVKNTIAALGDLARFYISLLDIKIVAITGSVGKTSTKDMIASILSTQYSVIKTQGNFNNEIGLPLTVFNIDDTCDVAILEMGMSEFGEIRYLSSIAKPNIAVISNIGTSHIENLGSREGILKAKSEIFENLKEGGLAVLNADDDMLLTLKEKLGSTVIWFGIENKVGLYADHIQLLGLYGVRCAIHMDAEVLDVNIPSPGKHMVYNVLSGIAVGRALGLSLDNIKKGIENFIPTKMRMNIVSANNDITIINDTYNASPQSMVAAIDVLKSSAEGRKIAILGDMLEMGNFAQQFHAQVGDYVASCGIDIIICIGEYSKFMYEAAKVSKSLNQQVLYFSSQQDLEKEILNIVKSHDTILVKASRGMYLEKTVDKIEKVKL